MNRRDALIATAGGVVVLSASALGESGKAPAPAAAAAAAPAPAPVINTALYQAALDCVRIGEECVDHCVRLLSTGDKSMAECAGTVRVMLPLCRATADLARLGSPHLKTLAAVCAKACRDCEAACKKHAGHHAACKACMESCDKCATECEKAAA